MAHDNDDRGAEGSPLRFRPMTRVGFLGPPGTFTEEALLTQPDLAAGEAVPFRDVPHVIAAVERARSTSASCRSRTRSRARSRSPSTRSPSTPSCSSSARSTSRCRCTCARRRARSSPTSPPSSRTRTRSASAASGWRSSCPTRSRWPPTPPPRPRSRSRSRASAGMASIGNRWARPTPASRSSPARSRTTPRTRPASCSSATASPRRPATTRRRSCASSARTARARCSRSSRSSRPAPINLTKLESRPTKRDLGDYCFFIDFEGHLADELVADCLRNLAAKQAKVKFLGSYPVAGRRRPRAPQGRHQGVARRQHVVGRSPRADPPRGAAST